uniref:Uncharacterized protein n=1 Tax=Rhizophora mucronata TaxID=61149 RepID=A0A2P2QUQ5_RHIMU
MCQIIDIRAMDLEVCVLSKFIFEVSIP